MRKFEVVAIGINGFITLSVWKASIAKSASDRMKNGVAIGFKGLARLRGRFRGLSMHLGEPES